MRVKHLIAPSRGNILKQVLQKAARKGIGILIAVAAIPLIVAFIVLWLVVGIGGRAAASVTRRSYEKEEDRSCNF